MSKEQFLVITGPDDEQFGHVPFVAQHMEGRKLTVVDPAPAVVEGKGLSYRIGGDGPECLYDGMPSDRVAAVWHRRPTPLSRELLQEVDPDLGAYAREAVWNHMQQLYTQFPRALWVSDRYAISRAGNKLLQLQEAAKLGFRVPDTVFTSDPAVARQFVSQHDATIIKGMSNKWSTVGDTHLAFFSTLVHTRFGLRLWWP